MALVKMKHDVDPKQVIWDKLGDISDVEVYHNQILVATYQRPEKIDIGNGKTIFIPGSTQGEEIYQGKAGMVVAKGPLSFRNDKVNDFGGQDVNVGDWVFYRASDGWPLSVNGVHCRMLEETHIKGRIPRPDRVF